MASLHSNHDTKQHRETPQTKMLWLRQVSGYRRGLIGVLVLFGGAFLWIWLGLLSTTGGGLSARHPFVWADWSAHLIYAAPFAFRPLGEWFTAHPIFAGAEFTYPFLPDALSGLLMRAGLSVATAFIVPSIIATTALLYLLYRWSYQQTRRALAASFTVLAFFCAGGLGFLFGGTGSYTNLPERGVHFMNIVVSELLPQRNFLFGLCVTLAALLFVDRLSRHERRLDAVIAGVLAASLTIIHPHSLIALAVVSACYAWSARKRHLTSQLIYAGVAFVGIALHWVLFLSGSGATAGMRLQFGWMAGDMNIIWFWLLNFGLLIPLYIVSVWRLGWQRKPIVQAGGLLFIICNIIVFQQWDWDNAKVLTYAYLCMLVPVTAWLVRAWDTRQLPRRILVVTAGGLLIWSGLHDIAQLMKFPVQYQLYSSQEEQMALELNRQIPPGAIVLTSQRPNQAIAMLTGAQLLWGYDGWVWSYGIDSSALRRDVPRMYAGGLDAATLLKSYNVSYVVIDLQARTDYAVSDDFWSNYTLLYQDGLTEVYRID